MRVQSQQSQRRQTLSIIIKPQTYQRLHQEIGKGKISRFVEELIINGLSGHNDRLAREQREFQQKLVADYKRDASSKVLRKEDEI